MNIDRKDMNVLLVEDNPHDVELTLRAFKANNFNNRVDVVSDGKEALDFLFCEGKHSKRTLEMMPKLILLDLKLPKMSGLEFLSYIKDDERTKNIPIVVLTSSKEEQDIVKSYDFGVNSYIVKPTDFDQFCRVISSLGFYWLLLNEAP